MLMKYVYKVGRRKSVGTYELTDAPVVNVEKDGLDVHGVMWYTAYFEERHGSLYYFTFTEAERALFVNPKDISEERKEIKS